MRAISSNVFSPRVHSPRPAAGEPISEDARREIDTMRSLRDLLSQFGNSDKADKLDKRIREVEQAASKPGLSLTPENKAAVKAYLEGTGPLEDVGLDEEHTRILESVRKLHRMGFQFAQNLGSSMPPAEAFEKLVARRFHAMGEQVMYQTVITEGEYAGMLSQKTLRPEYVEPLAHFLEFTQKGYVFYTDESRPQPIYEAEKFIKAFKGRPQEARVKFNETFLPAKEAEFEQEKQFAQVLMGQDNPKPRIQDQGDSVVVGGIVLKKRA